MTKEEAQQRIIDGNMLIPTTGLGIWTDGSLRNRSGAIGVVFKGEEIETHRLSKLYEPIYSSFQIEVYAIRDALFEMIEVYQPNGSCINVFTDSQYTLTHLRSLSLNPRPIFRAACDLVKIIDRVVREYDLKISFYWIPGHTGIALNEEAYQLAKSRLKVRFPRDIDYISIPRSRLKRINREITKLNSISIELN